MGAPAVLGAKYPNGVSGVGCIGAGVRGGALIEQVAGTDKRPGIEGARVGDPVELWGPGLGVNEVAAHADTIGYELLAGLTGRVPLAIID